MNSLLKLVKAITTLDLSDSRRKQLRTEVFEYELSNGLLKLPELVKKSQELQFESGSPLEGRVELCLAFWNLSVGVPTMFEQKALPKFLKTLREKITQVSDEELMEKFLHLYLHLETELALVAVMRYYFLNDQGEDSTDVDESCLRFQAASERILLPMVKKNVAPGRSRDDFALQRNLRLQDVLGVIEKEVFYDDRFSTFMETFSEEAVLQSAFQLTMEVQKALYGIAKGPSSKRPLTDGTTPVTESTLGALRKSTGPGATTTALRPIPMLKRAPGPSVPLVRSPDEVEDEPEAAQPIAKRIRPGSDNTTTTMRKSMGPPQLPMLRTTMHQPISRSHRADLGETQPDTPPEMASPKSMSSSMSNTFGGGRARFTDEEDEALRSGVKKYGLGRWKAILEDSELGPVFNSVKPRTAVNLKDRWRNLQQKG